MDTQNKTIDTGVLETAPVNTTPKKRGRKPNPNKDKMYFSEREEEIFKQYCSSEDENFRNKVFNETLYPVFTKMVESIIRRYTLFTPGEDFEDTFNDAMSHLISKVNHFDPNKKSKDGKPVKAYSYCGTICKNYALHKRKKTQDKMQTTVSYDVVYNDINQDLRITEEKPMENDDLSQIMMNKCIIEIEKMVNDPLKYNLNDTDVKVGCALINILKNWDDIFCGLESKKYNKSQVDSFIREVTMLGTKPIRDAKKKFAVAYYKLKEQMLNED